MSNHHKLFLPWKVVHNWRGKIAIVDSRNNGQDTTSGRVCNIASGKDGRGDFIANEIVRTMNARLEL
jgi:hypothetical protein